MTLTIKPGGGFLGCSHPDRRRVQHKLAATLAQPKAATGTIFFPDVSGYQSGLRVQPATAALLAKATEGSTFTDGSYGNFKAQAAAAGAVFGAYHFVWGGSMAEAQHCHSVVGSTPLMLDVENTSVALRLSDVLSFVSNYRSLGGVVHLAYLPRWYWEGTMGSPSLVPLAQAGVSLVSSNYTTYSDAGPGWSSYGGVTPVQWQYTDALPYGGQAVDFNAFKGTASDYAALLTGQGADMTPAQEQMLSEVHQWLSNWRLGIAGSKPGAPDDVEPVRWEQKLEAFESSVTGSLSSLATAVSKAAGTTVTVDAETLAAAFADPKVVSALAAAIAGHIKVS